MGRKRHARAGLLAALVLAAPAWAQPDPFQGVPTAPPATARRAPPMPAPAPRPQAEPRRPRSAPETQAAQPDLALQGPVHRGGFRLGVTFVPLPPGDWVLLRTGSTTAPGPTVLSGGRGGGADMQLHTIEEAVLLRQEGGRITGIVVAQAATSDARLAAEWYASPVCARSEGTAHRIASANERSQDCARVVELAPNQGIGSAEVRGAINAQAGRRPGFVPASMAAAQFRFANTQRALTAEYRFAGADPSRLASWAAAQDAALRTGFGGRQAGPLTAP